MKEAYTAPQMEVARLDEDDAILTSPAATEAYGVLMDNHWVWSFS